MTIATVIMGLVAVLHVYFLVLDLFMWKTREGRRVFGTTPESAAASGVLAANPGLYNGFLAGVFSALTANHKIIFIQAAPAAVALAAAWWIR